MGSIRYLTAGESHGIALTGILEGVPAGLEVSAEIINAELARRQMGYGRGGRMKIEKDTVQILSGVRNGKTLGSPIALMIENRDWQNWKETMTVGEISPEPKPVTIPRPGHADLAGSIKYRHTDIRNVIERASARETATRVALGSVAKALLGECGISIGSHVTRIGGATARELEEELHSHEINERADRSRVRCLDPESDEAMVNEIKRAVEMEDTVGGVFEVIAGGIPPGLGSYVHWDRKLDGRIAGAMMSIPAMKGVEIGTGFDNAACFGSAVHDEIIPRNESIVRTTNRAGGLEGGVTNGMPIVVRVAMKPISTLRKGLRSVDLATGEPVSARHERSDVCAVPAAAVIGEAVLALVLADALLEKFGGDSMEELTSRVIETGR